MIVPSLSQRDEMNEMHTKYIIFEGTDQFMNSDSNICYVETQV